MFNDLIIDKDKWVVQAEDAALVAVQVGDVAQEGAIN